MLWFALILLLNSAIPGSWLYGSLSLEIGGANVTLLDILLFGLFPVMLLLGRSARAIHAPAHGAFKTSLALFALALGVGAIIGFDNYASGAERWYVWAARGFLTVPVAMVMAHRALRDQRQCRTVVWLLFIASVGSAILSILTASVTSLNLSQEGGSLEKLRKAALDVPGDSGIVAACLVIFAMVSRVRLARVWLLAPCFLVAAAGMFLMPHRSSWVMFTLTCLFAGLWLWPTHHGRKILVGGVITIGLLATIVSGVMLIQSRSEKDFVGWIERRIQSFLPDDNSTQARAWDSRLSGMQYDMEIWSSYPFGGGFGIHDRYAMENGQAALSYRHTPWTSTLAETGPFGVAAFGVLILSTLVVGLRLARYGPDRWTMLLGAAASCIGLFNLLCGWLTLSWNVPRAALMLGLTAGVLFRARAMALNQAAVEEREPFLPAHAQ